MEKLPAASSPTSTFRHLLHLASQPLSGAAACTERLARRLRIALVALALAVAFSLVTHSGPVDDLDAIRSGLRAGADRLVALQHQDGTWSRTLAGAGEARATGRPARALLVAHAVLGDARYLEAAERAADHLRAALERDDRVATTGNLLFLAELGAASGDDDLVSLAATRWLSKHDREGLPSGAESADRLLARPNPTRWDDAGWRNYLLWHAGEQAELARAVGQDRWADRFSLAIAESWVPKHDHAWWTMGAGRMLESLASIPGDRARSLARVETSLLRNNEVLPGLPWNETPYDQSAFTMESAACLQGLLVAPDPEAREAAVEGVLTLVSQQAPHGGWGARFRLFRNPLDPMAGETVPPKELAVDETPELDAEVVLTLAMALQSRPTSTAYLRSVS